MKYLPFSFLSHNQRRALLGGSAIVLVALLASFIFLPSKNSSSRSPLPTAMQGTPAQHPPIATAVLSFRQPTATSARVLLDTGRKGVTAVQLELSFDPHVLRNLRVTPGTLFDKSRAFLSIDYHTGTLFFVLLSQSHGHPKQGRGIVATISYSFTQGMTKPTTLQFLPETKVTAAELSDSILKRANGITISPKQ